MDAYTALNALLNPSTPHGESETLTKLVESYAARSDWVHLVVALDTGKSHSAYLGMKLTSQTEASSRRSLRSSPP